MSKAYELAKRSKQMGRVREAAAARGVHLRTGGLGWMAMVGVDDGGAVWVWDELTRALTCIADAGTVDVNNLPPEPGNRGRPAGPEKVEVLVENRLAPVGFVGFSQP